MACKAFIFKVMQTKASDPVSVRDDAFFISVVFIRHAFLPPMKSLHFFPKMGIHQQRANERQPVSIALLINNHNLPRKKAKGVL